MTRTKEKPRPEETAVSCSKAMTREQVQPTYHAAANPLAECPQLGRYETELSRFARAVIAPTGDEFPTPGILTAGRLVAAQRAMLASFRRRVKNPKRIDAAADVARIAGQAARAGTAAFDFDRLDAEAMLLDMRFIHRRALERVVA